MYLITYELDICVSAVKYVLHYYQSPENAKLLCLVIDIGVERNRSARTAK